jgi:hypothetical protein
MPAKSFIVDGVELPGPEISNGEDRVDQLHKTQLAHKWDPNLPPEKLDVIHDAVETNDNEKAVEIEKNVAQDSQYESVRAAVRNTDGGEVANTVRAWVLGMLFVTIGSGLNMFLSMR